MITDKQYLKAVKIIRQYHNEIRNLIHDVDKLEPQRSKKVECLHTHAAGHYLYFLTVGKEYEIIHNPKTRGIDSNMVNELMFGIIDDNGKKRFYKYTNPSRVWKFLP